MSECINVIGAGLAGCEAALKIASYGVCVNLYEMKPTKFTEAHENPDFAELVCSNSLKAVSTENASGILKKEMELLGSVVIESAYKNRIPAGGALAVDRKTFSSYITKKIKNNKNIKIINNEVLEFDLEQTTVMATGPLTSQRLSEFIAKTTGENNLYFYDAAAPVIGSNSIDMRIAFKASRYGKGSADYINCPMDKKEYNEFYKFIISAERAELKKFENEKVFEGCLPVEVMAHRGYDTMRFGPMKPVGLENPKTGKEAYAVVQLRSENTENSSYNLVGFQTNLKFSEQRRMMKFIPGLLNAEIERYGVMHRNTYINSPEVLNKYFQMQKHNMIFMAGQITGVEGYLESSVSGIVAGINAVRYLKGKPLLDFGKNTITGALASYISGSSKKSFQPMNSNFGILAPLDEIIKDKKLRRKQMSDRAVKSMEKIVKEFI